MVIFRRLLAIFGKLILLVFVGENRYISANTPATPLGLRIYAHFGRVFYG